MGVFLNNKAQGVDSSFLDFSPFCLESVSLIVVVTILISKILVIIRVYLVLCNTYTDILISILITLSQASEYDSNRT